MDPKISLLLILLSLILFLLFKLYSLSKQMQKMALDREEKQLILQSLEEGVISVDPQMRVCEINQIGSKMLGIPRSEILGKPLFQPKDPSLLPLIDKCRNLLLCCQKNLCVTTDCICIEESKKIYFDLIALPKKNRSGTLLILQDKSSHHKVLEMGKDFIANASHELRTPITIIKGFTETLQDLPELPKDMVIDITEKIVRNCQRMDTLVKNLLTLADLENLPNSKFQECDLISLVDSCIQVILSVYPEAQVVFEKPQEPILVAADPDILELAIMNLMDNAAKYSPSPAQITICIHHKEPQALLSIQDKGIGIPSIDLEHIFERFYTVDKARCRRLGGAGLGLSIVKTIIEKHHATISVTSKVNEGTTFLVCFPNPLSFPLQSL